ncbi:response regulator [Hyphobacterium sp.]|jgi:DNA-directed RNA polymerase specialized sigma24 family protein|uniref:response regulator n=1 Tax=Hyphobacterium sp. TaxID=2004662 RepID=UPI003BAB1414
MSQAEKIAPHLPYLRRFGRALTGSQESGDACVRSTLQALIEDRSVLDSVLEPRTALYRVFCAVWSTSVALVEDRGTDSADDAMSDNITPRLTRIPPKSRAALLLTTMEGFSERDAAQVLSTEPEEIKKSVKEALNDIQKMTKTDVFIIEDEPIIAADLKATAESLGHNVIGMARTRDEAVKGALDTNPGLILADIQLADDSSGIDAVQDIMQSHACPVIFITAFPERLLTGERPEPTYLITKPFRPETVKAAIGQALFFA